jgi:hypothetical protein
MDKACCLGTIQASRRAISQCSLQLVTDQQVNHVVEHTVAISVIDDLGLIIKSVKKLLYRGKEDQCREELSICKGQVRGGYESFQQR